MFYEPKQARLCLAANIIPRFSAELVAELVWSAPSFWIINTRSIRVTSPCKSLWQHYRDMTQFLVSKSFFLAGCCLVLMVVPVVADVVLRTVSPFRLTGSIEIEELLLLLVVFLSLAWPQLREEHIDVDLLFPRLSLPVQRGLSVYHWGICAVLIGVMAWELYLNGMEKWQLGEFTAELSISTGPFYLVAALGLVLTLLTLVRSFGDAVGRCVSNCNWFSLAVALAFTGVTLALPWLLEDYEVSWNFMMAGAYAFVILVGLLLLRMPIGYCMSLVGIVGLMVLNPNHLAPLSMMGIGVPHAAMSYTMTVIPMFIFMGELALYAGISKDLFNSAAMWLGKLPGGLAISSVAGCAGFAAICGDSLATAMTMSSVALPEMKKRHYNNGLACATLAAGGTLGILIPPSVGFIMYAIITEESLGKLFVAGVIPGVLLAVLFCIGVYILARFRPDLAPRGVEYPLREKLASLRGVLPMLGLVLLVLGGILVGFFSPTEGGAVGAAGTFIYAVVTRRLTRKDFIHSVQSTVSMTTKLMLILIGVNLLGYFLAATRIPFELADLILSVTDNKYLVFTLIVLLYVALGCMLNVVPMILLTLPAIFPTVLALGFDPIWFGVVTVILMEMGQITPPMGLVVFAIAGMPEGAPMAQIFKFVLPFVLAMFALVILLVLFPSIAMFLPNLLF